MREIVFARNLTGPIDSGRKVSTIRAGWRDYRPGRMLARCDTIGWKRELEVTAVLLTKPRNISAQAYGYEDMDELIESLRKYYPDFSENSPITIVAFRTV